MAPTKLFGMFEEPGGLDWNLVYDENGVPGGKPLKRAARAARAAGRACRGRVPSRAEPHEAACSRWSGSSARSGCAIAVVARRRKAAVWSLVIVVYWVRLPDHVRHGTAALPRERRVRCSGPGIGFLVALAAAGSAWRTAALPRSRRAPAEEAAEAV